MRLNFLSSLGVRAIATPLACGNTVIFKGSENCPRTHQLIVEAFEDAGFPPGVVNYITNAPADAGAVVEAMVAHPAVRRVNFTGSTKVGKIIAMTCAKYLKPAVLELGGKAALCRFVWNATALFDSRRGGERMSGQVF